MKILVAGAGLFGREHMALLAARGVPFVVADPVQAAADRARNAFGVKVGTDAAALMDAARPDGVIIAAPAAAHLPLAVSALARGLPVLVEKSVAETSAEARHIARLAADGGSFAPPDHAVQHRALALAVLDGVVGRVLSVTSRQYRDASHAQRYADVDPVLMTMIHDIDLAFWMSGRHALSAQAQRATGRDGRSVTHATLRDADGGLWHLISAWTYPGEGTPPDRIEVLGEEGSLELTVGDGLVSSASGRVFDSDPAENALLAEQQAFLSAIRSGTPPREVTMEEAIAGLTAAEMVLEALCDPEGGAT